MKKENKKIYCSECGSSFGYMRQDGCFVCRACGELTKIREIKK